MKRFILLFCVILTACNLFAQERLYDVEFTLNDDLVTTHYRLYLGYNADSVGVFIEAANYNELDTTKFVARVGHDSLATFYGSDSVAFVVPIAEDGRWVQAGLVAENANYITLSYKYSVVSVSAMTHLPLNVSPDKPEVGKIKIHEN